MSVEFGPRGNQAPTSRTESSDISPESLRIPKFYSSLARRPLPPIIAKMQRQASFQTNRTADAHPVMNPEGTSRKRRAIRELHARLEHRPTNVEPTEHLEQILRGRRPIARSTRELPRTKAIELELSHHLDPDNTVGADQNGFEDDGTANVFIAADDVLEICEIVRMSHLESDDETEDLEVTEVLYEEQALHESALTSQEPDTLELSLRGQVIEYVEKPQAE